MKRAKVLVVLGEFAVEKAHATDDNAVLVRREFTRSHLFLRIVLGLGSEQPLVHLPRGRPHRENNNNNKTTG